MGTLRDVVENGGGRGSCGEGKINPFLNSDLSAPSGASLVTSVGDDGSTEEISPLAKELPRSSLCKLRLPEGRGILPVVEVEDIRSCS